MPRAKTLDDAKSLRIAETCTPVRFEKTPSVSEKRKSILWVCNEKGHEFHRTYKQSRTLVVCPTCKSGSGDIRKREIRDERAYRELPLSSILEFLRVETKQNNPNKFGVWLCSNGHEIKKTYYEAEKIKHLDCPACNNRGTYAHPIGDYVELGKQYGCELLSESVNGVNERVFWRCDQGHEFWYTYKEVGGGTAKKSFGCPKCNRKHRVKIEQDYHDLAQENDLVWTGESLPKKTTELTDWRCNEKWHDFKRSFTGVQSKLSVACRTCGMSLGEQAIAQWLKAQEIIAWPEHKFDECRSPSSDRFLKFDFWLPDYGILIEFQGEQHFRPRRDQKNGEENFKKLCIHDAVKRDFADDHGIPLIFFTYRELKRIEKELERRLLPYIER